MRKITSRYSCDFETNNADGTVKISTFIRFENKGKFINLTKNDIDKVRLTYNIENMLDLIVDENDNKKGSIELWYTNSTNFDAQFILRSYILPNKKEQTLNRKINENQFSILEPTNIGAMIIEFKYRNILFSVRDIKLYTSLSVAEKGRIVGLEKGSYKNLQFEWLNENGDIIWNKLNWDILTKNELDAIKYYAKKDSLIDALYYKIHFETLGYPKKLTKSSEAFRQAYEAVKIENMKRTNTMKLIIPSENCWTKHMQGGLNYANKNYLMKLLKNCQEYDVRNMYVDNMTKMLPLNEGRDYGTDKDAKLYRILFNKIELKEQYKNLVGQGFLPSRYSHENNSIKHDFITSQYITYGENIIHEIWDKELYWYKKIYDIKFEILEIKYFELGDHLKPFMLQLYNNRMKERKLITSDPENATIHEVLQNDYKIIGNSVYGILAENPEKEQYYYSQENLEIGELIQTTKKERECYVTSKTNTNIHNYFKYIIKNAHISETRKNIYIGSYVTMLGRIKMYPEIITGKVIRCDTDGYTATYDYKIDKRLISDGLGGMKLEIEKMKPWFMLFGYKMYFYSDTIYYKKPFKIDGKWCGTVGTMKGLRDINIVEGTLLTEINWLNITGKSINKKKTEYGVILENVEKKLNRQSYYQQQLNKEKMDFYSF